MRRARLLPLDAATYRRYGGGLLDLVSLGSVVRIAEQPWRPPSEMYEEGVVAAIVVAENDRTRFVVHTRSGRFMRGIDEMVPVSL